MAEQKSDAAIAGLVIGGLALCCGFSAVISAGVVGVLAGLGFESWVLLGVGVVVLVTGLIGLRNHSRECPLAEPNAEDADETMGRMDS